MQDDPEETLAASRSQAGASKADQTLTPANSRKPDRLAPFGAHPDQGAMVGRYIVLSKLGVGAMGVVFAAYDPQLDRKVALKLLKPRGGDEAAAQVRLQREAQALARLNHPNVVAVHDVGVHDRQVFVAMEFIEGRTLGAWMKTAPHGASRPWREVIRLFEAAGRGLVAAHEVGLVHRDFKPENVMLGEDGRVRVMDFGLVRATEDVMSITAELSDAGMNNAALISDSEMKNDALEAILTQTGAVLGTPAYMAPEQFADKNVTARSDQFGYCVALFEALYGMRPFAGDTAAELAYTVAKGLNSELPHNTEVPRWLRTVVVRGLSLAPQDRFGSMHELLVALGSGEARRRRNRVLGAVGGIFVMATSLGGYQQYDRAQRISGCTAAGDVINEVWNGQSRPAVRDGLVGTGASHASTVADKVMPWLDSYAESWRKQTISVCMNAMVHKIWKSSKVNKAHWCLEERHLEFLALVTELQEADKQVIQDAVQAAAGLVPVQGCIDEEALASMIDPPPATMHESMAAIREELSRAKALMVTGKYQEGLKKVQQVQRKAEELQWPPLRAAVRQLKGELLERDGAYGEAEEASVEAYMLAAQCRAWEIAAAAASTLVKIVGYQQQRHAEGKLWAKHAAMVIAHAGDPIGLRESKRLTVLGIVHYAKGEYEDAEKLYRQSLKIQKKTFDPNHPRIAGNINNIAEIYQKTGEHEKARKLHKQILNIKKKALGSDHPAIAESLNNLATSYYKEGQHKEAKKLYEQALSTKRKTLESGHPSIATTLNNLAVLYEEEEEYKKAIALNKEALNIRKEALGADHPATADSINNIAVLYQREGNPGAAKKLYKQALAILNKSLGPDHPNVTEILNNLAILYQKEREYEKARGLYNQSMAILRKTLGPDHPSVATPLNNLASLCREEGKYEEAKRLYKQTLAILKKTRGLDHPHVAVSLRNLAKTHLQQREYDEAKRLYEQALTISKKTLGPDHLHLSYSLFGLGSTLAKLGEHQLALEHLERAMILRAAKNAAPALLAQSRFKLAQVLWDAPAAKGQDRTRARSLAKQARDAYAELDDAGRKKLEAVKRWLSSHQLH